MTKNNNTSWQSYEEVARYLLNQIAHKFDLACVEGKQTIVGQRSGTKWEVDAKGVGSQDGIFVLVECRRYTTSRQKQEELAALAYRIFDTGASGGIIVSPLGIQEGAEKIAQAEEIYNVILDQESTTTDYILRFLNEILIGRSDRLFFSESVTVTKTDAEGNII